MRCDAVSRAAAHSHGHHMTTKHLRSSTLQGAWELGGYIYAFGIALYSYRSLERAQRHRWIHPIVYPVHRMVHIACTSTMSRVTRQFLSFEFTV
jgi:hypothetical protein